MNKTLFVCYRHGCRGENLSHRISQHEYFSKLEAKTINGRTVIMNEYFDKRFLMHRTRIDFSKMHLPTDKNIVVPSHYFFDTLGDIYPNAKFVSIDVPKDLGEFKQSLYNRYFEYRTNNFLELMGECEDKFWRYNRHNDFKEFVREVLSIKNRTSGDILCLARGMKPTVTNKQSLLNKVCPEPLNNKIIKNSLVIPYEDVKTINIEDIITYVKK